MSRAAYNHLNVSRIWNPAIPSCHSMLPSLPRISRVGSLRSKAGDVLEEVRLYIVSLSFPPRWDGRRYGQHTLTRVDMMYTRAAGS